MDINAAAVTSHVDKGWSECPGGLLGLPFNPAAIVVRAIEVEPACNPCNEGACLHGRGSGELSSVRPYEPPDWNDERVRSKTIQCLASRFKLPSRTNAIRSVA
jgi:hypothetical protein